MFVIRLFFIGLCSWMFSTPILAAEFLTLFQQQKPVIAAIMVPGIFKTSDDFQKYQSWAMEQARIAHQGGMDGILIEFRGGDILDREISPQQLEQMTQLTQKVINSTPLVVGVEILWHFPGSTLLLAQKSGARFVRIDFFSDEVRANKMNVPINPKALIEYRKKINAESVALLTDIQVKYSEMLNQKISIGQSAMTAQISGSDGVIVSGQKSGTSPAVKKIKSARSSQLRVPVIIGSGFSAENAAELLAHLDAIVVGTSISVKTGGPLIPEKVTTLMDIIKKARAPSKTHSL